MIEGCAFQMYKEVLRHFFTHKDYLPKREKWPGTLFTPLQIVFCSLVAMLIGYASVYSASLSEDELKEIYFVLWLLMFVSEPLIIYWETNASKSKKFEWSRSLSLWPCSIFLYVAPFAIFGAGLVKYAACGSICTLGLGGGLINFVYSANYLYHYSCISMPGFRTIFYHGAMVFTAVSMLLSGYHSYNEANSLLMLVLPLVPALIVSIFANIANYLIEDADYMFFKMKSFFLAPIGNKIPGWMAMMIMYLFYIIVHVTPYLPAYLS